MTEEEVLFQTKLANLWVTEFAPKGACMLCGNSGHLDTRGRAWTAAGHECGGVAFCICPNGRARKAGGTP